MNRLARKLTTTAVSLTLALALSGGSALAWECYSANRAPQSKVAAQAPVLLSLEEALGLFCGLDEDRIAEVMAGLEDAGLATNVLINGMALMAGGITFNAYDQAGHLLHNGKGIDHLSEDFFNALFELAPECGEE